jgi:hypothetical protein
MNEIAIQGVQPHVFNLFCDVVNFAHSTIFEVKPRHVGLFTTEGLQNPLIFQDPMNPRISVSKYCLRYEVIYKTYVHEYNQLNIFYFKDNDQSIVIQIKNASREQDKMMYTIYPEHDHEYVPFVITDAEDFSYLFKKWLYFDHNNEWYEFLYAFEQIVNQLDDQKKFEKFRSQQWLDIVRQGRKKQRMHQVLQDENLTRMIVDAGLTRR